MRGGKRGAGGGIAPVAILGCAARGLRSRLRRAVQHIISSPIWAAKEPQEVRDYEGTCHFGGVWAVGWIG